MFSNVDNLSITALRNLILLPLHVRRVWVFCQSLLTLTASPALNPGHMVLIDHATTLWKMLFGGP